MSRLSENCRVGFETWLEVEAKVKLGCIVRDMCQGGAMLALRMGDSLTLQPVHEGVNFGFKTNKEINTYSGIIRTNILSIAAFKNIPLRKRREYRRIKARKFICIRRNCLRCNPRWNITQPFNCRLSQFRGYTLLWKAIFSVSNVIE